MEGRRALGAVTLMAVVAILAGCASPGAGSLAPDTLSPWPRATLPPQATPPPTAEPAPALTPSPSAQPTPKPTPVPVPPKPSGVTFNVREKALGSGRLQLTATVTWRSPRSAGVTIRVYSVTECLSMPTPMPEDAEGPCLVEHTSLPPAALKLVATAPASAGTVSWTWIDESELGWRGATYEEVVVASYSASGHSIFAIAAPGHWNSKVIW